MGPTGPLYGSATSQSGSNVSWTSLSNALVEDGAVATSAPVGPGGGGGYPNQLIVTGFGFNLPSYAVVTGIKLEAKVSTSGGAQAIDNFGVNQGMKLNYNGGSTNTSSLPNANQFWPSTGLAWLTWGGAGQLWGKSWLYSDINNANFGAQLAAMPGTGTASVNVDSVRITVYWRPAPAKVPKRYYYQIWDSAGQYVGLLPAVVSEFNYGYDINSAGTNLNTEVGISPDTSMLSTNALTDESGNILTDESSNILYNEGVAPVITLGLSGIDSLIKNGNQIQVTETSYYWPAGKVVFAGEMVRWEASFGGMGQQETIKIMSISNGQDLDNYVARGAPFGYTLDQASTSENTLGSVFTASQGAAFVGYGQTFQVGAGVTNLAAINLMLYGTANVTVNVYTSISLATLLGSITQTVSVAANTVVTFGFAAPILVSPGTPLFFTVTVDVGQSIGIYYQNTAVYGPGSAYEDNYGGGGGGGYSPITGDLYFQTYSGTGTTSGLYSNVDPATGFLVPVMNDYISRGGIIGYTSSSIVATGLSVIYQLNTNTVYEAVQAALQMSPNGYYYTVDLATGLLSFKPTDTTADFTLIKGLHILSLNLIATIENIKNQVFFTGGIPTGQTTNIYVQTSSATSIAAYGVRLDRQSNDRVTDAPTGRLINTADLAANKYEQYQTTVSVLDQTTDITQFKPGQTIGFSGFGGFIDLLVMQIVHIDYYPSYVTLTLGVLPKRLSMVVEEINRSLIAAQTLANPTSPS